MYFQELSFNTGKKFYAKKDSMYFQDLYFNTFKSIIFYIHKKKFKCNLFKESNKKVFIGNFIEEFLS